MYTILNTIRLAWRNLLRNRKRTLLSASGLAVALIIMVILNGLYDGITRQTLDNMIREEQAHVRMFAEGYLEEVMPGLDYLLTDVDSLAQRVAGLSGAITTARMQMPATFISNGEETILTVRGLNLKTDRNVFRTLDHLVAGQNLDGKEGEALIGRRLAKEFSLKLDDSFIVLLKSAPGAMNSLRLKVHGIIDTGHPDFDGNSVIISLKDAQTLALADSAATEIAILGKRESNANRLRNSLKASMPGYDWQTWEEGAEDFMPMIRMKRAGSWIMVLILALVAMVAITNTMTMAVHERTREIGSLRAMGYTSHRILWLFLTEGLLIGLIAGVAAVVVGGGVTLWLSKVGISLAAYDDIDFGMAISTAMYPALSLWSILGTFIFGVLLGALSSWRAAWYAAHGQVVRALREGML
ncbi:MAG: FtsX-like permease family protein [bacterium]